MPVADVFTPVHDWTFRFGTYGFGILEYDFSPVVTLNPRTQVFIGPASFETNLSAWTVVGIGAAVLVVAFIVLAFVVTRFTVRRPEPG